MSEDILNTLFGRPGCVTPIIETACSSSGKVAQTVHNAAYLKANLRWLGYKPKIPTGAGCWNGCLFDRDGLDFAIQYKKVPKELFTAWYDDLLEYLGERKDECIREYLSDLMAERIDKNCDVVYEMITVKYNEQKLSALRGALAQFINLKTLEDNLYGTDGIVRGISFVLNVDVGGYNKVISRGELDIVASFPSKKEYLTFLDNLSCDKDIALWIRAKKRG